MTQRASDVRSLSARRLTQLAPKLDTQLLAYAAAASAAGVGLFAQSAEAKVVYTPANVTIPGNTSVTLDLNNDGIADFVLSNASYFGSARREPLGLYRRSLGIDPSATANEVWTVQSNGADCVAALPAGTKVGAGDAFTEGGGIMWEVAGDYTNQFSAHCQWNQRKHGAFVGLKFLVDGQTHYGWAHVTVGATTVLNGYAYETVPNQPILTGKTSGPTIADLRMPLPAPLPAGLGALALGASGLQVWRRPEEESRIAAV